MKLAQSLPKWGSSGDTPATFSDVDIVVERIITVFLGFAAITLFVLLLVGGLKLIGSGGDPGKVQAAWKTITYAVLGIVLIAASYLILKFISTFTGVELFNFSVIVP